MAFFNELIETIERTPPEKLPRVGATESALMYAPRRLRPDRSEELRKAEAERAYWRDRAFHAEAELKVLEARVRRIAATVTHS